MTKRSMVHIRNLGLLLIVLLKNINALVTFQEISPGFFLDYTDDVINSVLLMLSKQWIEGLKIMLGPFEKAFSHLSLVDKFGLVQVLFKMYRLNKNSTHFINCLEKVLQTPKVATYIDWQEKNP